MRQQGQYVDTGVSDMMAAQARQISSQRSQHNSGMGHYSGNKDSFRPREEHLYSSKKTGGLWQWDKDGSKGSHQLQSHYYSEGQRTDASPSFYEDQRSDSKLSKEKQVNKDPRVQPSHIDQEIRYLDNTLPPTFEALEQKFLNEIMNLVKEHQDAEDRENARHRESLSEINAQYEEKLRAIRAHQATRREEFLQKESHSRHQQHQQANTNSFQNSAGPSEVHGYGAAASASNTFGDANRAYAEGRYNSYERSDRSDFPARGRGRGYDLRGPYPSGPAYNSGGRRF